MKRLILLLACSAAAAACGGSSCPDDIHRACARQGCADKVKALLAKDPSLTVKPNGQGLLPLHVAADAKSAEALIEAGADVNLKAGQGQAPPLYYAIQNDRGEVIAVLLSHGAENKYPDRYLLEAVEAGAAKAVEALVDAGAQVNLPAPGTGATPLHVAALKNRVEAAKILIKKGADVNAVLAAGVSTMSMGATGVGSQIKTETSDAGGSTPLSLARSEEMKKLLKDAGAR